MASSPSPFRVLAAGFAWRLLGTRRSGEFLLRCVASDDEQNRMLAGMALVKAGQKSATLIRQAQQRDDASPRLERILEDVEGPGEESAGP